MRLIAPLVLMVVLVALMGVGYWAYLTRTIPEPYDEIWIALNTWMPGPLRAWACGDMAARLGPAAVPPLGCEGLWEAPAEAAAQG